MLPILHQSYWRDEAFSVLLSSKSLGEVLSLTIKDVHPPLYYFLLHFWIRLFGDAEYVTRSLSLFFHFLLVLSCFFLLKHFLKNWKVSSIGTLAIFLNPFLLFFVVTALLFYLKRKSLISSLFLALMILTHNFGFFFLVAFVAFSMAYILFAIQGSEEILRKTAKPAINWGVKEILAKAQPGDVVIPESNLIFNFLETKYYVKKSGKDIPVYAYSPDRKIVFYIGAVLFEENEIISEYPEDKRVWMIAPDGGYYLRG